MTNLAISQLESLSDPNPEDLLLITDTSDRMSKHISIASFEDMLDFDILWDKMYVHAKKVIVPCGYCGSHNAYTNPTCVRCGAPMGEM